MSDKKLPKRARRRNLLKSVGAGIAALSTVPIAGATTSESDNIEIVGSDSGVFYDGDDGNITVGTEDNTCGGCSGGGNLDPVYATDGSHYAHQANGAIAKADHDLGYGDYGDVARIQLLNAIYGTSYSRVRLWGKYTPDVSGNHVLNAFYWRHMHIAETTLNIRIFIRRPGNGPNWQTIESLHSGVKGYASYSRSFNMDAGVNYDVGLEVIGTGSSTADAGDLDMWSNSKNYRLELDSIEVDSP